MAKTESFRAYDGISGAVEDLKKLLLEDSRYADVVSRVQEVAGDVVKEVAAFADALQESGYATDPQYANKIKGVADTLMRRFGVR